MYRELTSPPSPERDPIRLLKRGALGLTAIALAGWLWQRTEARKKSGTNED
jgi:hypothetical protein